MRNFVTNLVNMAHDQPDLWNTTAILNTFERNWALKPLGAQSGQPAEPGAAGGLRAD